MSNNASSSWHVITEQAQQLSSAHWCKKLTDIYKCSQGISRSIEYVAKALNKMGTLRLLWATLGCCTNLCLVNVADIFLSIKSLRGASSRTMQFFRMILSNQFANSSLQQKHPTYHFCLTINWLNRGLYDLGRMQVWNAVPCSSHRQSDRLAGKQSRN